MHMETLPALTALSTWVVLEVPQPKTPTGIFLTQDQKQQLREETDQKVPIFRILSVGSRCLDPKLSTANRVAVDPRISVMIMPTSDDPDCQLVGLVQENQIMFIVD